MRRKSQVVPTPSETILKKVRAIGTNIVQEAGNDGLTTPELIEVVHRQTRELAQIFHQLSHRHSRKEGENR